MTTVTANTRIKLQTILYTTDFSQSATTALPYARDLARLYGSKVLVAHVAAPIPFDPESGVVMDYEQIERRLQKELRQVASSFTGLEHGTVLLEGTIWPALKGLIEREKVDLIVTGTHGRTGIERALLGSVAEEIFRQAECPVLSVGPKVNRKPLSFKERNLQNRKTAVESNIHTILFATDFSQESISAAPFAISLAREHAAKLVLLHVVEDPRDGYTHDPQRVIGYFISELKQLIAHSDEELWCEPTFRVELGSPAQTILEVSKQTNSDLIVMGVRSAKGHLFAATHVGPVTAHSVVVQANVPVLTVRG